MERPNSSRLRPEEFLLGSTESRAAARAELQRRGRQALENALVVIMTGIPGTDTVPGPRRAIPPDRVEYHEAPDGSVVEMVYRHWGGNGRNGVTIYIEQTWPDGSVYQDRNGPCYVKSLAEALRLPGIPENAAERKRAWTLRK